MNSAKGFGHLCRLHRRLYIDLQQKARLAVRQLFDESAQPLRTVIVNNQSI